MRQIILLSLLVCSACSGLVARTVVDAEKFPTLQAAINALPETGGVLRLSPGTIEILEPLVLKTGDVMIQGWGPASHIKNLNTEGKPALMIVSGIPSPKKTEEYESLWRVQLGNFRITGNQQSGHGIKAIFVNELFVDGLTISEHGGDGIHMRNCYEDGRINDSLITYNKGAGVFASGNHDTVISANHFEENNDGIRFVEGFNLTATGNNIDDHLRHGIVIENTMGNTLSGNMIEQCQGAGIVLDRDTYGTTMAANVFTNDREGGISLLDAHGCTITGNTFSRVPMHAVLIDSRSHAITVNGNTFSDSGVGEGSFKGAVEKNVASGITLRGATLINITGNTFSNLQSGALDLDGNQSGKVIFSNNLLINCVSQHEDLVDSKVEGNLETKVESFESRTRSP